MSLTTSLKLKLVADLVSALDLATVTVPLTYEANATLASGTGASQADMVWHDQRTIAGSGTEDLDLSALTNAIGQSIAFTNIKIMLFKAAAANGGDVTIGPRATEGFADFFGDASDRVALPPSGVVLLTSPVTGETLASDTDDKLTITNTDGSAITYDVVIVGVATVS